LDLNRIHSIGPESFSSCKSLASIPIPSTDCKLGARVFRRCTGLRSVTLPETLEIIEDRMFDECISPTHIEIPPTVTEIGVAAFQYCKGSKNLLIPSSVTRIECAAFVPCTRLISLELPEGLGIINLGGRVDSHDEEPNPPNGELRNIYACRSLVNLVMQSEQNVEQLDDDEAFMENFELRHVASKFDDLARKLQHRFDDLPVHRLCYYQSYYPMQLAVRAMFRIDTNKEHILIIEHLEKL
jgi:hypothetical protein